MNSTCGDISNICINDKGKVNKLPQITYGYAPTLIAEFHGNLPKVILRYQRTEYAKKIRKQYEAGNFKERRCNMREYTVRTDGRSNTITTVCKDNYLLEMPLCVAMRGRYNETGKVEQHLEPRFDGITNTITTVNKDNMVLEQNEISQ